MTKPAYVDANYRFIGAYQEVNARIAQRQQALALYITLVVSMLAALVALSSSKNPSQVPVQWVMLGFPVASLCLAFLNYKAERAITNLRNFLSALEQLNNAHDELPSYNTHHQWSFGANKARRFYDYASAVLVIGGNVIGLGTVVSIYSDLVSRTSWELWLSILIAGMSVWIILVSSQSSFTPNQATQLSPKSKTENAAE
jgi:hypothetical protein